MPPKRIPVPEFVGGTNVFRSPQFSDQRSINIFPESTGGLGGKVAKGFRPAEGIQPLVYVAGASTTSAMFYQDDRAFAACGEVFIEFFEDGTYEQRGVLADDGTPASIASNGSAGNQVAIASGKNLYIYNLSLNTFVEQDVDGQEIAMVEYVDGYFLALVHNSRRYYYSAINDGTSWAALDYIERNWGSDNIAFLIRSGRQIWIVGTATTEIHADSGNANVPFAPIQGAFVDMGSYSAWTAKRDGDTITWLSQDERGGGMVVRATGYSPSQITTYGVAPFIQSTANDLLRAEAFVHQIDGHTFYWLYIPGMDTTLVYDFSESAWAERALWDQANGIWEPHIARCHCYAWGRHFVGARDSGMLYEMSSSFTEDILT